MSETYRTGGEGHPAPPVSCAGTVPRCRSSAASAASARLPSWTPEYSRTAQSASMRDEEIITLHHVGPTKTLVHLVIVLEISGIRGIPGEDMTLMSQHGN